MTVTWRLSEKDPKSYLVFRDDELWKKIPKYLYVKELKDLEMTEEAFLELEQKICTHVASSLLLKQTLTSGMLRSKLKQKRFESSSVEHAIQVLEKHSFLQDDRSAKGYIEKLCRQGYGPRYIVQKARMTLKMEEEQLQAVLDEALTQELIDEALAIAKKKTAAKTHEKQIAALLRRGFSYESVQI